MRSTLSLLVALVMIAAFALSVTCPVDDSGAYSTGKTRTDRATGKLLTQYKCNRFGHVFWVRSSY